MKPGTGNQHQSRKRNLLACLTLARICLKVDRDVAEARHWLNVWQMRMFNVPASTRRRWRCGR